MYQPIAISSKMQKYYYRFCESWIFDHFICHKFFKILSKETKKLIGVTCLPIEKCMILPLNSFIFN